LIAGDALVRGGRLDVGAERRGNTTEIVIRAEGPRLAVDPEIAATLNGQIEESALTPRAAAAWLARSLSIENGGNVQVAIEDGVLIFGATLIAR
jgi:histidine phosphotransferase ChpT